MFRAERGKGEAMNIIDKMISYIYALQRVDSTYTDEEVASDIKSLEELRELLYSEIGE